MTTEQLILGHFDNTLTAVQEQELQNTLAASPEARGEFEAHRRINDMMVNEAATLAPSSSLDERVVLASLAVVPEIIGGVGLLAGSKLVAGLGALLVGGVAIFVIASSSDSPEVNSLPPTPVVRSAPATPQVAPPQTAPAVVAPNDPVNENRSANGAVESPAARVGSESTLKDRSARASVDGRNAKGNSVVDGKSKNPGLDRTKATSVSTDAKVAPPPSR